MLLHRHGREREGGAELQLADLSIRGGSSRHDVGGTLHQVTQVIVHHLYDPEVYDYDIALLKVSGFQVTVFVAILFIFPFRTFTVMFLDVLE